MTSEEARVRDEGISRKRFLAGAAAVVGGAAAGAFGGGTAAADGARRGLTYRGVFYEVGDGESAATAWNAARMRRDMRAIRHGLHADSVVIAGNGVERLAATASEAAERGLSVWLQPRLGDRPETEIMEHLAEAGRVAERMRRQGAGVHLSVGAEFLLFVPGIVPGDNVLERVENVMKGNFDPEHMARRLREVIARAAAVGRSVFNGPLTYGAAADDEVDWSLFDVVSVNYYAYHERREDYVRELRNYRRWGKPVAISECGSCTYEGAPQGGGMGWYAIDYTKPEPEIRGNLVRSERTQAEYLGQVLDVFDSMGLYAAMVYQFVSPELPHRAEPRYDLDMAGYSLVKTIRDEPFDPESAWHWEPKEAFHTVAGRFRRAAARRV
ncbi:hypothetical protein ABZ801_37780 [Actinomadura sp. NPDC047616]|uniref:hypothetical protein n=1 Tax=Actinomadura sp. NPDC047616 TaxID=3155914 RepID=UPI0033D803EA